MTRKEAEQELERMRNGSIQNASVQQTIEMFENALKDPTSEWDADPDDA